MAPWTHSEDARSDASTTAERDLSETSQPLHADEKAKSPVITFDTPAEVLMKPLNVRLLWARRRDCPHQQGLSKGAAFSVGASNRLEMHFSHGTLVFQVTSKATYQWRYEVNLSSAGGEIMLSRMKRNAPPSGPHAFGRGSKTNPMRIEELRIWKETYATRFSPAAPFHVNLQDSEFLRDLVVVYNRKDNHEQYCYVDRGMRGMVAGQAYQRPQFSMNPTTQLSTSHSSVRRSQVQPSRNSLKPTRHGPRWKGPWMSWLKLKRSQRKERPGHFEAAVGSPVGNHERRGSSETGDTNRSESINEGEEQEETQQEEAAMEGPEA
ncbi:hypothetical protein QFC22_002782 [Naganishia vaughanmartiniae]|uniref:Uncharacterized protein n=1 Tax=Naganishia vaughanmartiniae TaxID=1424756 RepID=A0ACC2X9Z9_9TREE|nr:hypothetical protein QFC22_002782 [Naganishia vaughanmartiniae]